jgi:hypothetical protein
LERQQSLHPTPARDHTEQHGVIDGLAAIPCPELDDDLVDVTTDRRRGNGQIPGDLAIRLPTRQNRQDSYLGWR